MLVPRFPSCPTDGDGHEAFGEEASALALRTERALTPQNDSSELFTLIGMRPEIG